MRRNNKLVPALFAVILMFVTGFTTNAQTTNAVKHEFPQLPYAYNALEPYFDAATMEIHYSKHHRAYYDNFLKSIARTELEFLSMEQIFAQISKAPVAVKNMGGGYYNHNLFWENLSPVTGSPSAELAKAIDTEFGSTEAFMATFSKASSSVFGSGWAWLILDENGKLAIVTSSNQDNPLMDTAANKGIPLIAFDVWEHAYYLKYQNKRADYISAFWKVINWNVVNSRYQKAISSK